MDTRRSHKVGLEGEFGMCSAHYDTEPFKSGGCCKWPGKELVESVAFNRAEDYESDVYWDTKPNGLKRAGAVSVYVYEDGRLKEVAVFVNGWRSWK